MASQSCKNRHFSLEPMSYFEGSDELAFMSFALHAGARGAHESAIWRNDFRYPKYMKQSGGPSPSDPIYLPKMHNTPSKTELN